jgi:hypothetical protein
MRRSIKKVEKMVDINHGKSLKDPILTISIFDNVEKNTAIYGSLIPHFGTKRKCGVPRFHNKMKNRPWTGLSDQAD